VIGAMSLTVVNGGKTMIRMIEFVEKNNIGS
jgi:hypothetical protein